MNDMKRHWADLAFEKKLGIVIVPIVVAVIGVTVPLVASPGDDGQGSSASPDKSDALAVEYRKDVGDVCERLGRAQEARRRAAVKLRKVLLRADSTVRQRNALIDDTQRSLDRSTPIYAAFGELTAPVARRPLHERTARRWKESLRLLRAYRASLEAGVTRERLITVLTRFREGSGPTVESNGVEVRAGLEGLGGADCDLAAVRTVPVFTLPPVKTPSPGPTATATPPIVPPPDATVLPPIEPTVVPPIVPTPVPTAPPPTPTPTPSRSP